MAPQRQDKNCPPSRAIPTCAPNISQKYCPERLTRANEGQKIAPSLAHDPLKVSIASAQNSPKLQIAVLVGG